MRIVNGPIIMTREERMKIVHEIKERILDKYGDDVKAIGVYGSLGRQTDGPLQMNSSLHACRSCHVTIASEILLE